MPIKQPMAATVQPDLGKSVTLMMQQTLALEKNLDEIDAFAQQLTTLALSIRARHAQTTG